MLASFDYLKILVSHACILHVLVIYYCETNDPTSSKENPTSSKRKPNYVFSLTILECQESRSDLVDSSASGSRMRLLSRSQSELGSSGGSTGAKPPAFKTICSIALLGWKPQFLAMGTAPGGCSSVFTTWQLASLREWPEGKEEATMCFDLLRILMWLLLEHSLC